MKLKAVPKDQAGGSGSRSTDDGDVEIEYNVARLPLIPEGNYSLSFVRAERKEHLWGRSKIFLHFSVIDPGAHHGTKLFMSANLPANGHFPLTSKFIRQWSLAAGLQPKRRDRLSTKVFKKKVFLGAVRTVTQFVDSDKKMKARHESTYYSVVAYLIEVLAGRPDA